MQEFGTSLGEAQHWSVINFIRAIGAADGARGIGRQVEPDRAWLVAPDFTISVGPLAPAALRDYRGQREQHEREAGFQPDERGEPSHRTGRG